MNTQPTQWEIDWAQDKLAAPSSELSTQELYDALCDSPDSELYQLALQLFREQAETQH